MSAATPMIDGGLLSLLPTELLRIIFKEPEDEPEKLTSYKIMIMIKMSCRYWSSSDQRGRLGSAVESVALRSPAALRTFALDKHLSHLKNLYIVAPTNNSTSLWALERTKVFSDLQIVFGQYSPQLEIFSWLWYSQACSSPAIPVHHFASFPWPNLHTLEARLGRLNEFGTLYTEFDMSNSKDALRLTFSTMPQLRAMRVSMIDTPNIVNAFRAAADPLAEQLEELIIRTIEDPDSRNPSVSLSTFDVDPSTSTLGSSFVFVRWTFPIFFLI
jgi:hypothetical protein